MLSVELNTKRGKFHLLSKELRAALASLFTTIKTPIHFNPKEGPCKRPTPMSREEIDKLESIGFNWSPSRICGVQDEVDDCVSEEMPASGKADRKRVVAI